MKRTQIQRRTPLRAARPSRFLCPDCQVEVEGSTCERCGTSGLAPILTGRALTPQRKRQNRREERYAAIRAAVMHVHPVCERCACCASTECHHRVTRARGGEDHPRNLAALCAGPGSCDCHGEVHRLNEEPWLIPGRMMRTPDGWLRYEGPFAPFVAIFNGRAAS